MAFLDPTVPIATCDASDCTDCPVADSIHTTLKCWANHGSPKLWEYRPGPMSTAENVVFFSGIAVVWGYPLPFFVIGGLWFLLGLYVLLTASFFVTLKMFLCSQCMNFACPLNGAPDAARAAFFLRNPAVGRAWKADSDERASSPKPRTA